MQPVEIKNTHRLALRGIIVKQYMRSPIIPGSAGDAWIVPGTLTGVPEKFGEPFSYIFFIGIGFSFNNLMLLRIPGKVRIAMPDII
jgi:hypothetical protein